MKYYYLERTDSYIEHFAVVDDAGHVLELVCNYSDNGADLDSWKRYTWENDDLTDQALVVDRAVELTEKEYKAKIFVMML